MLSQAEQRILVITLANQEGEHQIYGSCRDNYCPNQRVQQAVLASFEGTRATGSRQKNAHSQDDVCTQAECCQQGGLEANGIVGCARKNIHDRS